MEKMMLMAQIMQRAGALGDAKLTELIGELMSEVATDNVAEREVTPGMKYVLCVEATVAGKKIQHPVIGGSSVPRDIDGFKMTISDNLVALQEQTSGMKSMIESRFPVKVRYVPVTDEQIASLETKLKELLENLETAIDEAAEAKAKVYGMMNIDVNMQDISSDMLAEIIRKTIYSGAGIDADGNVVVSEEECDEMQAIKAKAEAEEEESEEDCYDEDDWDECSDCDGCCGCCKE